MGQGDSSAFYAPAVGNDPANTGLMTGFVPMAPVDPGNCPVWTMNFSSDINNPSSSWTMTDAGTSQFSSIPNVVMPANGETVTGFTFLSETFTYSSGGSNGGRSSSHYAHLDMTESSINFSKSTFADGKADKGPPNVDNGRLIMLHLCIVAVTLFGLLAA